MGTTGQRMGTSPSPVPGGHRDTLPSGLDEPASSLPTAIAPHPGKPQAKHPQRPGCTDLPGSAPSRIIPHFSPARSQDSAPSNKSRLHPVGLQRDSGNKSQASVLPKHLENLPGCLQGYPEPRRCRNPRWDERAVLISIAEPQVCQPKQVLTTFQKGSKPPFFHGRQAH